MKLFGEKEKDDVIKYQINLNDDQGRRNLTAKRELRRFEDIYHIRHLMPKAESVLCVGARDDSEVMTFIKAGYDAKGIDVCTRTPLITKMDIAKINPDTSGKWDIIYCSHVLEHIKDSENVLRRLRSIARGLIFVILPIVDREPDIEHPTVYDIMRYGPETNFKDFPRAWEDFELFQPYKMRYKCYRNALTEDYEIAFIMEVTK